MTELPENPQHIFSAMNRFADQASGLGRVAAELAGAVHDAAENAQHQTTAFSTLSQEVVGMTHANEVIVQAVQTTSRDVRTMQNMVDASLQKAKSLEEAVILVEKGIFEVSQSLRGVSEAANEISKIAFQTRLVAFNASVEAVRAGEAGRGFAVVAQAVKDLADKVQTSSQDISRTIRTLSSRVHALESTMDRGDASHDLHDLLQEEESSVIDEAIRVFQEAYGAVEKQVASIQSAAVANNQVCRGLLGHFSELSHEVQTSAQVLREADKRVNGLLNMSEELIVITAESGIETADSVYIRNITKAAAHVGQLLEMAVQTQEISMEDLFDENYRPIANTDPQQYLTRFTELCDRILPPLQEDFLQTFSRTSFCVSVDRNGYLPTHNQKYSHKQRPNDPVWNAANCRNRRIFNDRTGLAAARNRKPFLLQTYRRDMGGGRFLILKDLSAPIMVLGRHWGGLRLGYNVE